MNSTRVGQKYQLLANTQNNTRLSIAYKVQSTDIWTAVWQRGDCIATISMWSMESVCGIWYAAVCVCVCVCVCENGLMQILLLVGY